MKRQFIKSAHWILIVFLPFIVGCQTGISSLFGLVGLSSESLSLGGGDFGFLGGGGGGSLPGGGGGGEAIAVVHNPEPASMILLGSGMIAMACLKRKKSNR